MHPKSKFQKGPDHGGKPNKAKAKNKKNKLIIKFDAADRKDYLKGFKKRKDERRKKAFEKIQSDLKKELQQIRTDRRKMMKKMIYQNPLVDDVLPEKKLVTSCGSATVEFTELDLSANDRPLCKQQPKEADDASNENDDDVPFYTKENLEELGILSQKDLKRSVRKGATRSMKASKLMQKKEKRHARVQRKKQRQLKNENRKGKRLKKNHKFAKPKNYDD